MKIICRFLKSLSGIECRATVNVLSLPQSTMPIIVHQHTSRLREGEICPTGIPLIRSHWNGVKSDCGARRINHFDQTEIGNIKTISRTLQFCAVLLGNGRTRTMQSPKLKSYFKRNNDRVDHASTPTRCWPNGYGLCVANYYHHYYSDFSLYVENTFALGSVDRVYDAFVREIWDSNTMSREIWNACVIPNEWRNWEKMRYYFNQYRACW